MAFMSVDNALGLKRQLADCIEQLRSCGELLSAAGSGQDDRLVEALIKTKDGIFDAKCLVKSIDDIDNVKTDLIPRSMELVSNIKRSLDDFLRPSKGSGDAFELGPFCQGLASDLDALCGALTALSEVDMSARPMMCVYAAPPPEPRRPRWPQWLRKK